MPLFIVSNIHVNNNVQLYETSLKSIRYSDENFSVASCTPSCLQHIRVFRRILKTKIRNQWRIMQHCKMAIYAIKRIVM